MSIYAFRFSSILFVLLLIFTGFAKASETDYLLVEMVTPEGWKGKRLCNEKYMRSKQHEKAKIWIHSLHWGESATRAIERGECDLVLLDDSFEEAIRSRDAAVFYHVLKKKVPQEAPDMEFSSGEAITEREGMSSFQHESTVVESGVSFMKWEVLFVRRDRPVAHYWSYMAPQQLYDDYLETATKSLKGLVFLLDSENEQPRQATPTSKPIAIKAKPAPKTEPVVERKPISLPAVKPQRAVVSPPVHDCDHLAADPDDPEISKLSTVGVLWPLMPVKEAINTCRAAVVAYPHEPRFAFQLARALRRNNQLLEAVKWYRKAAEQGYAVANAGVGDAYYSGWGTPVDYAKAREHWLLAVDKGYVDAMLSLAMLYDSGSGIPKDPTTALVWYRKAAEKGNPVALFMVGQKYESGEGAKADLIEAISWYQRAAEKGQGDACALLGYKYLAGHGFYQNPVMAAKWYVDAVANGHWEPIDPDYLGVKLSKKSTRRYWREVQTRLRDTYAAYQGKIDGKEGPKTRQALNELKERAKKAGRISIYSP